MSYEPDRGNVSAYARDALKFASEAPVVATGTVPGAGQWTLAFAANNFDGVDAAVCVEHDGGADTLSANRYPQPDGSILGGRGQVMRPDRHLIVWTTEATTIGIDLVVETDGETDPVPTLCLWHDPDLDARVHLAVLTDPTRRLVLAHHRHTNGSEHGEDLRGLQAKFDQFRDWAINLPKTSNRAPDAIPPWYRSNPATGE